MSIFDLEHFTPGAQAALTATQEALAQTGYREAEPEHILLGLTSRITGRAYGLLYGLGVDIGKLRGDLLGYLQAADVHNGPPDRNALPFSNAGSRALDLAQAEASREGGKIGEEHILKGIAGLRFGKASLLLRAWGVLPEVIDRALESPPPPPWVPGPREKARLEFYRWLFSREKRGATTPLKKVLEEVRL